MLPIPKLPILLDPAHELSVAAPAFFAKVNHGESGCMVWSGRPNQHGHGRLQVNGKTWYVQEISYLLYIGIIPDGAAVSQTCQNSLCVSPWHLILRSKGKWVRGISHDEVLQILYHYRVSKWPIEAITKHHDIPIKLLLRLADLPIGPLSKR